MPKDDGLVKIGGAEEADDMAKQASPAGSEQDFSWPVRFRSPAPEADFAEANNENANEQEQTEQAGVFTHPPP